MFWDHVSSLTGQKNPEVGGRCGLTAVARPVIGIVLICIGSGRSSFLPPRPWIYPDWIRNHSCWCDCRMQTELETFLSVSYVLNAALVAWREVLVGRLDFCTGFIWPVDPDYVARLLLTNSWGPPRLSELTACSIDCRNSGQFFFFFFSLLRELKDCRLERFLFDKSISFFPICMHNCFWCIDLKAAQTFPFGTNFDLLIWTEASYSLFENVL